MAKSEFVMEIKIAWWFWWIYLPGLHVALWICQQIDIESEPNWDRVEKWIGKAIKIKGAPKKVWKSNKKA